MDCWVVVVDDEVVSLTNAKNILSEEGMRVSRLRSGRDLLKFMTKNTPDLILLDIMMPEMDGFQTYHELRRFEEETGRKQTPVIFTTGGLDSEIEHRGLEEGASDFIRKPFNKDILVRRVYNIVTNAKVIETLMDEASIDKLTGLWNRAAGTKRIEAHCETGNGMMMILDLDNFKLVNDLYGHEMGDKVLQAFAEVLRHNTRKGDVAVRLGGDEFMAFFCGRHDEAQAAAISRRMNEQFVTAVAKLLGESLDIPLGISMGAVTVPGDGREYGLLFPMADNALYRAKHNGKHGYVLYASKGDTGASRGEDLGQEMERITQIVEERNDSGEAMLLGIDQFSSVYRFVKRCASRYEGKGVKVLLSLSGKKGEVLKDDAKQFGECLQKTLSRSDIILQNKTNQFFLLLPEIGEADIPAVLANITGAWKAMHPSGDIRIKSAAASIGDGNRRNP